MRIKRWMETQLQTHTAVLTAARLAGGGKVGEERVKLIYTEERLEVHFNTTQQQEQVNSIANTH